MNASCVSQCECLWQKYRSLLQNIVSFIGLFCYFMCIWTRLVFHSANEWCGICEWVEWDMTRMRHAAYANEWCRICERVEWDMTRMSRMRHDSVRMEQHSVERHSVESWVMSHESCERHSVESWVMSHESCERHSVESWVMSHESCERHSVESWVMSHESCERHSVESWVMSHESCERHSVERHTLERHTVAQWLRPHSIIFYRRKCRALLQKRPIFFSTPWRVRDICVGYVMCGCVMCGCGARRILSHEHSLKI